MGQRRTDQVPPVIPLEKEVFHNLVKTHEKLIFEVSNVFNNHGITLTQYDVLESIKNACNMGLPLSKIGERMLSRQPDVTRIVDRLEDMGWVARVRDTKDRRVVSVKLTRKGRALVLRIESSLFEVHKDQFSHLSKNEMNLLNQLLIKTHEQASSFLKLLP